MANIYLASKKLHRIFMFITLFSAIPMSFTGAYLKFDFMQEIFSSIDGYKLRVLHSQLSPLFSASLTVMMLTGVIMYFYPLLRRK